MAESLYEKPFDPSIISAMHCNIHNLVSQYAAQHDGYKVLYAMLKDQHPTLKCNVCRVPSSPLMCRDIYEYATKFDSHLTFEKPYH